MTISMTLDQIRQRRLRRAATLIIIGLVIQGLTFVWSHPAAFLVFALLGGGLVLLGVVIFMLSVFHPRPWVSMYRLFRMEPPEIVSE